MSGAAHGDDGLADHIVAALAPCRYEGLISRRTVEAICRSECGALPAGMTSLFGFECRLANDKPAADFLVRIGAELGEWPVLARYAEAQSGAMWRQLAALARHSTLPDLPLAGMLKNVWLEYDLVDPADPGRPLSVFFGTDKITGRAKIGWAVDLAAMLRGELLSAATLDTTKRLVAALPKTAKIFQVGIMCARRHAPLQICIIGQKLGEVCGFLDDAGWDGELPRVVAVLNRFADAIDHVALDLDVLEDGSLGPKLGVELYQRAGPDPGWQTVELVKRLRDNGLCTLDKADGLLAWSGITHERRHRDLWPAGLLLRKARRGGNESSTFCRWLHHVKIVLAPDAPPAAKAYLAVGHAFLADAAIRAALEQAPAVSAL